MYVCCTHAYTRAAYVHRPVCICTNTPVRTCIHLRTHSHSHTSANTHIHTHMKAREISQSCVVSKCLQSSHLGYKDDHILASSTEARERFKAPSVLPRMWVQTPTTQLPLLGLPLSPAIWRQTTFSAQATGGSSKSAC